MTWTLRWGRVSHLTTYGSPVKTATGKNGCFVAIVAMIDVIPERMFPMGGKATQLKHRGCQKKAVVTASKCALFLSFQM
jgi:hypothetical protein